MPVVPLFDHLLNTSEPDIGADAFPLGDGGTPWAVQVVARTGSAGIYALTALMCTLDGTKWTFAPTVGVFPCNFAAKIAANNAGTYDPCEILIYFVWDDTKTHLLNGIVYMDDAAGNQWGAQIRIVAGQASIRAYRVFTNNSFLGNTAVNFTKPANGTNCVLKVRGSIDSAFDLLVFGWVYNIDTDPTMASPIGQLTNNGTDKYAGTFSFASRPQGISIGDGASATLTSPDITRVVVNGLTAQLSLQSGGGTVNIHSTSGQRYIPVYPDTFPGSPVAIDVQSGLPSGCTVNTGLSNLAPNTDDPGWIVLDCVSVTPGTYGLTLRAQQGGETGTVACSLVVADVLARTAATKRVVAHGSSSMATGYPNVEDEANVIYETAPNQWVYTQYLDAFATLSVSFDWLLVPDGGTAQAHAGLQLGLINKAHYLAGGAGYYNAYNSGDEAGSKAAVIAAYDALWGQYVKNGIHVVFIAHQEPANAAEVCSGSLVNFTAGASTDTLELESGEAALCEAGDGIYITSTDTNSLQFAEIQSVSGSSVITEKFLRTDDLPAAGRAYYVGDKLKHLWMKDLRTQLGKRGTEGEAEFIEDATTGARVWFLTRDQIAGGQELHDRWRMYSATDRFHVQAAGNPGYGAVVARGIAWVDIERGSPTLTPNPLNFTVGDGPEATTLTNSVDGDPTPPSLLVGGDYVSDDVLVATVDSAGEVSPVGAGSTDVQFRYDYNDAKDPATAVEVTGGGGSGDRQQWPFGFHSLRF